MKSQRQVLNLLRHYTVRYNSDAEQIIEVLKDRYNIATYNTVIFNSAKNTEVPFITFPEFVEWLNNGYAAFDIVRYHNKLYILGDCVLKSVTLIAKLNGDEIIPVSENVEAGFIVKATEKQKERFYAAMYRQKVSFDFNSWEMVPVYIPDHDEKVIFHKVDYSEEGVGVVRHTDLESGEIELYCYFIYPTENTEGRIGYSMHETNVVDLIHYAFHPIEDRNDTTEVSGFASFKRLGRELARHNKTWKDKLHRIEPLTVKVKKGEKYWYIDDKLKVITAIEKETPTSHFRYIAGNYFVDYESALMVLSALHENIQGYLASPSWPDSKW